MRRPRQATAGALIDAEVQATQATTNESKSTLANLRQIGESKHTQVQAVEGFAQDAGVQAAGEGSSKEVEVQATQARSVRDIEVQADTEAETEGCRPREKSTALLSPAAATARRSSCEAEAQADDATADEAAPGSPRVLLALHVTADDGQQELLEQLRAENARLKSMEDENEGLKSQVARLQQVACFLE